MNIEIEYEAANNLANAVLVQNYKDLKGGGYYDGEETLEELLAAFRMVIEYSTTNEERQAQGIVL